MKATIKNVLISPRKLNLAAGLMRQLVTVDKCVRQLTFHPRRKPCGIMLKLLNSALANAKMQGEATTDLQIDVINVGRGSANSKRTYFRGRGKVDMKEKYSSTVSLFLKQPKTVIKNTKEAS